MCSAPVMFCVTRNCNRTDGDFIGLPINGSERGMISVWNETVIRNNR